MIVFYSLESETKSPVQSIHHMPDDPVYGLTEEQKAEGIRVEGGLPADLPYMIGKNSQLYVNLVTGELWYEYTDRPLTQDEKIQQLQDTIDMLVLDSLGGDSGV